jgi:hypothetical protein
MFNSCVSVPQGAGQADHRGKLSKSAGTGSGTVLYAVDEVTIMDQKFNYKIKL